MSNLKQYCDKLELKLYLLDNLDPKTPKYQKVLTETNRIMEEALETSKY
jgi:hypothetical protein